MAHLAASQLAIAIWGLTTLAFPMEGNAGLQGAPPGDLLVTMRPKLDIVSA
jgi:hypothetical protein